MISTTWFRINNVVNHEQVSEPRFQPTNNCLRGTSVALSFPARVLSNHWNQVLVLSFIASKRP